MFEVVEVFVAPGGLLQLAKPAQGDKSQVVKLDALSELNMNAALTQVAHPVLPVAFARRNEQLRGLPLQRDKTFQPLARRQAGSVLRRAMISSRAIHNDLR
jgi:hypothetical protein